MNFLLNPGAGFDGERVLKGLDFAALLYRIDGQAAREVCATFYVCASFDACADRVICTNCDVCAARDVFDACATRVIPAKTAVLKQKRLYRIDGTVACSYSYFFGVTVPRMLKTILSGVPLVDTVIDLAMPPIRLVS